MRNNIEQGVGGRYSEDTARVAQLDRASASEAEGCGFNPRRAHHLFIAILRTIELNSGFHSSRQKFFGTNGDAVPLI